MSRTRKPPVSKVKAVNQLKEIHVFFTNNDVMWMFNLLPPVADFFFQSIVHTKLQDTENTLKYKLFLGETRDYQTWAVVKLFPKMTHVIFINEYHTGSNEVMDNIKDMALMYPFKAFKAYKDNAHTLNQLKAMIAYIYMYTKHGKDLFAMNLETAKFFLMSGMKRIIKTYNKKGGVKLIPNLHPPSENLTYSFSTLPPPQPYGDFIDDYEVAVLPDDDVDVDNTVDGVGSGNDDGGDNGPTDTHKSDEDAVMDDDDDDGGEDDEGSEEDEVMDDVTIINDDKTEDDEVANEDYKTPSLHNDRLKLVKKKTLLAAVTFFSDVPSNVSAVRSSLRLVDMNHWHDPAPVT